MQKFRYFLNEALHNSTTRKARIFNGLLVFMIVLTIAAIPLHLTFIPNLEWFEDGLFIFDRVAVTIFTLEFIARAWSAQKPARYIFSWSGFIDFVAIFPFYLRQLDLIDYPQLFLALRLLRILKIAKIYEIEHAAVDLSQIKSHGEFRTIPGERIERIVQKHSLVFLFSILFPIILVSVGLILVLTTKAHIIALAFAIVFFIIGIIFFTKAWIDHNYDVIYVTNRRVVVQDRELFGTTCNDLAYETITNVIPENMGIWHWIWGFGNVQIETNASSGPLRYENTKHPHDVVRHITENRQKAFMAKEEKINIHAEENTEIPPSPPGNA